MWIIIAVLVVLTILVLGPAAASFYTDFLWFQSVGQIDVFRTVLSAQISLFALGAGAFLVVAMVNLMIAREIARRAGDLPHAREGVLTYLARIEARSVDKRVTYGALLIALILAVFEGLYTSAQWEYVLPFMHPTPFGVRDPLFGIDVSFYVFQLPLYHLLQGWAFVAVILIAGLTGTYYVLRSYGFNVQSSDVVALSTIKPVRIHFFVIVAFLPLLLAWGYRLDMYDLVYAHRGVVHGAGFADVHAQLPAYEILVAVSVAMAVAFVVGALRKGFALPGLAIAGWVLAAILVGNVYPELVQQFEVQPTELVKETPYLRDNIAMTRRAFKLDTIDVKPFPGDDQPKPGVVQRNPQTFGNLRLWDYRALLATYNQIQTIRLYYDFTDVDVDRYDINGKYQQVMLSARELSPQKLSSQAQTWVTQRLQFTHGYGLAMSPVNEVTTEGLPSMIIKDIPPVGEIPVKRPEIYYGQTHAGYVIVDTAAKEFDYPSGNQNVYNQYQGSAGVLLNSPLRKLAFAIVYHDLNILLTSYLTPSSKILYHRQITDRADLLTPFLVKDPDPYLVVSNGNLYWIQDAYTVSDMYPYSTPDSDGINYIRNSVKIVTNAYNGSIHMYVSDPSDPMIQTYEKIFPSLFEPLSAMSPDLRKHIRYPEGMFTVQADMYQAYHMVDPQVFYNREDLWGVPSEVTSSNPQPMQPYYVVMRLPGATREEFLLMLPFTPAGKTNMVAWLAAESDGANYGKMIAYEYPKDKVIFGPAQVEARIDQDPSISSQLTLWGQQGSRVIRGNLLVLPIENFTLYVEPLYLQATQSQIPELKRVILATQSKVVMGDSLSSALTALFGNQSSGSSQSTTGSSSTSPASPSASTTSPSGTTVTNQGAISQVASSAQAHYQQAQTDLRNGDWTGYGQEMKALEADLLKLKQLTGQ